MKTFDRVVLAIGGATLAWLLWKMDPAAVWALVLRVGWGMLLIIPQEIVAHVFNAVGWRFAFPQPVAASFSLRELIKLRVAGDAVNYLTPSASIAGEFTRTSMLNDSKGAAVRASSVLVAKVTQAIAQMLFGLGGLALFSAQLPALEGHEGKVYAAGLAFAAVLAGIAVREARRPRTAAPKMPEKGLSRESVRAMAGWLRFHFREHPVRFAASTFFFMLGYAWGAFEAYWICWFLGIPVSVATSLMIEVLSTTIDAIFFMVPGKVGTQEGGKAAIFAALGLSPQAGFAFGVVRHIRELAWAGLGLAFVSAHRARRAPASEPGVRPEVSPINGV